MPDLLKKDKCSNCSKILKTNEWRSINMRKKTIFCEKCSTAIIKKKYLKAFQKYAEYICNYCTRVYMRYEGMTEPLCSSCAKNNKNNKK